MVVGCFVHIVARIFASEGPLAVVESLPRDHFEKSKRLFVDMVTKIIVEIGSHVTPYAKDIVAMCKSLFRDSKASVQNAAYQPLVELFQICKASTDAPVDTLAKEIKVRNPLAPPGAQH